MVKILHLLIDIKIIDCKLLKKHIFYISDANLYTNCNLKKFLKPYNPKRRFRKI